MASFGQLPVQDGSLSTWIDVACGNDFAIGLQQNGTLRHAVSVPAKVGSILYPMLIPHITKLRSGVARDSWAGRCLLDGLQNNMVINRLGQSNLYGGVMIVLSLPKTSQTYMANSLTAKVQSYNFLKKSMGYLSALRCAQGNIRHLFAKSDNRANGDVGG